MPVSTLLGCVVSVSERKGGEEGGRRGGRQKEQEEEGEEMGKGESRGGRKRREGGRDVR